MISEIIIPATVCIESWSQGPISEDNWPSRSRRVFWTRSGSLSMLSGKSRREQFNGKSLQSVACLVVTQNCCVPSEKLSGMRSSMSSIDAAAELNAPCACPAASTIPVATADRALLSPPCMSSSRPGCRGRCECWDFDAPKNDPD
jgi:hypothetical protein